MMRVSIAGLEVSIDNVRIVDGIDLTVEPGEMVGIIGPNGSGKSTLLRTIYRALKPTGGVVRLGDDDVWSISSKESAQRTAVVTQETPSEFDFSVLEVVFMGRTPHKKLLESDTDNDWDIVAAALEQVGMLEKATRVFATLSGGEKQRVLVARALAQQSKILILDEPTNHLDILHQLDILALVRGLGITVLTALHDLNLAAAFCDRVAVMSGGHLVAVGVPEETLTPELIARVFGIRAYPVLHPATGRMLLAFARES
ncbi:MAG: ABC transporter ATP-binding protein [Thermomicrobiales bacterium]